MWTRETDPDCDWYGGHEAYDICRKWGVAVSPCSCPLVWTDRRLTVDQEPQVRPWSWRDVAALLWVIAVPWLHRHDWQDVGSWPWWRRSLIDGKLGSARYYYRCPCGQEFGRNHQPWWDSWPRR